MERENNRNGIMVILIVVIVILLALVTLMATGVVTFQEPEVCNNNTVTDDTSASLNSNIIVTKNGEVISNEIPSELVGKYVNPSSSSNDYFEITNDNIIVSRSNCSNGGAITVSKENLKVYIDYLWVNSKTNSYVTIKFDDTSVETNKYEYIYVGNSFNGGSYSFKTIDETCTSGQGYFYQKQQ